MERSGANLSANDGILWEQRSIGIGLVEVFDDGHTLHQHVAVDDQNWKLSRRTQLQEFRVVLKKTVEYGRNGKITVDKIGIR